MLLLSELTRVERNSRKHLLHTFDLPRWEMGLKQMGNISLLLSQSKAQKGPEPKFFISTADLYLYTNQCHVFHILSHSIYGVAFSSPVECPQFTCYYTFPNTEQGGRLENRQCLKKWKPCVMFPPLCLCSCSLSNVISFLYMSLKWCYSNCGPWMAI